MSRCVITGTSNGLGACLARSFSEAGYDVVGVDCDLEGSHDVKSPSASGGSLHFLRADLSTADDVDRLSHELAKGPPIEVLIHCAGTSWVGSFTECDLGQQDRILEVNLIAPMILTAGLLNQHAIEPAGSVVFISSLSCQLSYPDAAVYAASKNGLASYASSLAAGTSLHVMTVYPGPLRTKMSRRWSPNEGAEARRMPPEWLAGKILAGVGKRKRILIPGIRNRCLALVGHFLPRLAEQGMKKTILSRK